MKMLNKILRTASHKKLICLAMLALMLATDSTLSDFGDGCQCGPSNPQHPQVAFCANEFVLKVKIQLAGYQKTGYKTFDTTIKAVFKVSDRMQGLKKGSALTLWLPSLSNPCGLVNVREPNAPIVSRHLKPGRIYLVTGHIEKDTGRAQINVCSWLAYWPTRAERSRLIMGFLPAGSSVSRQQARYLRLGYYANGCKKCQIDDVTPTTQSTPNNANTCVLKSSRDHNMCHAMYSFCSYHKNPYTGRGDCYWQSESPKDYLTCYKKNKKMWYNELF